MTAAPDPRCHAVVVNESRDIRIVGDVSVFEDAEAMCRWLEPWWVEDAEGFALSATGERILLGVAGPHVVVTGREAMPDGPEIVRAWLEAEAAAATARRKHGDRITRMQQLSTGGEDETRDPSTKTVQELIADIGFTA